MRPRLYRSVRPTRHNIRHNNRRANDNYKELYAVTGNWTRLTSQIGGGGRGNHFLVNVYLPFSTVFFLHTLFCTLTVCSLYGKIKRDKIDLVTIKRMKIGWFIFSCWKIMSKVHMIYVCRRVCSTRMGLMYRYTTYLMRLYSYITQLQTKWHINLRWNRVKFQWRIKVCIVCMFFFSFFYIIYAFR